MLLLPTAPGHDLITPELVQDHVLVASRESTAVLTLSGLRGQLVGFVVVLRGQPRR